MLMLMLTLLTLLLATSAPPTPHDLIALSPKVEGAIDRQARPFEFAGYLHPYRWRFRISAADGRCGLLIEDAGTEAPLIVYADHQILVYDLESGEFLYSAKARNEFVLFADGPRVNVDLRHIVEAKPSKPDIAHIDVGSLLQGGTEQYVEKTKDADRARYLLYCKGKNGGVVGALFEPGAKVPFLEMNIYAGAERKIPAIRIARASVGQPVAREQTQFPSLDPFKKIAKVTDLTPADDATKGKDDRIMRAISVMNGVRLPAMRPIIEQRLESQVDWDAMQKNYEAFVANTKSLERSGVLKEIGPIEKAGDSSPETK